MSVFWAIFEVEPSHVKFCTMLLISLITLCGIEMTLETYINRARARLFIMVICPFIDNVLCFQIVRVVLKFAILFESYIYSCCLHCL